MILAGIHLVGANFSRGTLSFNDLKAAGTTKLQAKVKDMQSRLLFDNPINIQVL